MLYIVGEVDQKANLFIFDTKSEREEAKELKALGELDQRVCIAQLPNGELFCASRIHRNSFSVFKIDGNYEVQLLPSEARNNYLIALNLILILILKAGLLFLLIITHKP